MQIMPRMAEAARPLALRTMLNARAENISVNVDGWDLERRHTHWWTVSVENFLGEDTGVTTADCGRMLE